MARRRSIQHRGETPADHQRRALNYEALYSSASSTGSYKDSRGYQILREQSYAMQCRNVTSPTDK